jgi:ubiquitin-like 1-activating enzyme E1 A
MASRDFTEREAEVYDRQIRLWGVEAQRRMRDSRVLIHGMTAVAAEVRRV